MINLNVVNENKNHFILSSDEPIRVEFLVVDGEAVAFVYREGEDEPIGVYDGSLDSNSNWRL